MPRTARSLLTAVLLSIATLSPSFAQRTSVLVPPGSSASKPRISGDGATVAYGIALHLVRIDGSDARTVLGVSTQFGMALSYDGSRLVMDRGASFPPDSRAWVLDTRTLAKWQVSDLTDEAYLPWISADGSVVAYQGESLGLHVVNADGSNPHVVGPFLVPFPTFGPSLTADGSVAVHDVESGTVTSDVYRIGTDGTGLFPLAESALDEIAPRISYDGAVVLYWLYPAGDLMAVTGSGGTPTRINAGVPGLGWRDTGREVFALSGEGSVAVFVAGLSIFVARTDGTGLRQIGRGQDVAISGHGDVVVHLDGAGGIVATGVPGVTPDEIHRLEFADEAASLAWEGRPSANVYNLYRGDLSTLRSGAAASCIASNVPAAEASDPSTPSLGTGWYYVVTGENGAGEGTGGKGPGGLPRALTGSCPPSDADLDGVPDAVDTCPLIATATQSDPDGDGIGDPCDNCSQGFNPDQKDLNVDGQGEGAPPAVQVTSPNGDEVLAIGQNATLTWTSSDDCISARTATIRLSRTGPSGTFETIATNVADTGSYTWTVTGPATQGKKAYLQVNVSDGGGVPTVDISNAAFRIQ